MANFVSVVYVRYAHIRTEREDQKNAKRISALRERHNSMMVAIVNFQNHDRIRNLAARYLPSYRSAYAREVIELDDIKKFVDTQPQGYHQSPARKR